MATLFLLGVALLMVVLALPLLQRRIAPNALYGLRVPATFADETVWYDANAAGARDLLILAAMLVVAGAALWVAFPFSSDLALGIACGLMVGGVVAVATVGGRRADRLLAERRAAQP